MLDIRLGRDRQCCRPGSVDGLRSLDLDIVVVAVVAIAFWT